MGEARNNPRSPQFRGELPDAILGCQVVHRIIPNAEAMKRYADLKAAGIDGQMAITEADLDIAFVLRGQWTAPSKLTNQHPQAMVDIAEIGRLSILEFKKRCGEAFKSADMPDFTASVHFAPPAPTTS